MKYIFAFALLGVVLSFRTIDDNEASFTQNKYGFSKEISFGSEEGEQIFTDPLTNLDCYFKLAEYFLTQETQSYCGIASATMVLNALGNKVSRPIDPIYNPHPFFTQEDLLENRCVRKYTKFVKYIGLTMDALKEVLLCFIPNVEIYHFNDNVEELETVVVEAIKASKFVIANIDRKGLAEVGGGHFSPIGAYSSAIDGNLRFLFMDVSRYKFNPSWFDAEEIVLATEVKDRASKKTRGFLVVG